MKAARSPGRSARPWRHAANPQPLTPNPCFPGCLRHALLLILSFTPAFAANSVAELHQSFLHPPDDARMMVRWWWFGPAATKPELERELRAMKEGGIGGFEVQPTYPLQLDGNYSYLSQEFLEALRFTGEKAKELGLRMDLTLGSGWPFGGPHISIAQASGRLKVVRVPMTPEGTDPPPPVLAEGEKLITKARQGTTLLFFISSHTRQMVKRPAIGAEGFVLDHYDLGAIQTHLKTVGEPMLKALEKTPPYAIFSDSLEVYNSDWTTNFLDEFRKRRGYDLTPYLPALAADIGEKTGAIRHDWGKTLSELADANYLTPLHQWAQQHGTRFRSQSYGIPPVTLSSSSLVDLPEGEGTQWRHFSATRWAASASHLYGRPVTSSETWTWLHSPVFRATPLDMKAEADLHFLQGVNQLVGHGWPYSPPEAGEPGWRFYAAAVFNNHNPWWLVMPDVTTYLQRVSYLLRQGQPANDVALYLPTSDAFAGFALGRDSVNQAMDGLIGGTVIPQILDAGYNFDFIDDGAIAHGGVPYPILILPNVERIPLATMQKIEEYVRKGGTVIATRRRPSRAPGLLEADRDTPKIRELADSLRLLTDETKLGAELHNALPADVATAPEIGFVHRKLGFAEVYFVANTSNQPVHALADFRVDGLDASIWDPLTGKENWVGGKRLDLTLAPCESRVIVFSKERGAVTSLTAAPRPEPVDLSGGWKVTFAGSSKAVTMDAGHSWTEDDSHKYFSGTATYEKTVSYHAADLARQRIYLTFGEGTAVTAQERRSGSGMRAMYEGPVREAAVVYVNGKRAGAVWCAPYQVELSGLLKDGENSIRIVVANTALNLMAKGPLPDYKALNAKYGERFQAQDMGSVQALPSGLLGPIKLVAR